MLPKILNHERTNPFCNREKRVKFINMKKEPMVSFNLQSIKEYLITRLQPEVIYLFGSYASGSIKPESDIDLAVLGESIYSKKNIFESALDLGVILNRDVHLIDFQNTLPSLKIQIISKHKILFCKNHENRLFYEMNALKEYQKLNEEREIVLKSKLKDFQWKLFSIK
ncbi:MAG TPA: nucleotidyltransferase domain-containing protein [Spirochaetia bacterium]|nr:nucleotidyltransferase domain-containing protein [Spirochaetia bacterium]